MSHKITFSYVPNLPTRDLVRDLIVASRASKKEGKVACHLLGAYLSNEFRFPGMQSPSGAFENLLEPLGDYIVGDTVFHVRTSPFSDVYEKCSSHVARGLMVYLLVPEYILAAARLNVEFLVQGRVMVESIESFVGMGIEIQSMFSKRKLAERFLRLLETYNQRVAIVENDPSLLIQIPLLLRRQARTELTAA